MSITITITWGLTGALLMTFRCAPFCLMAPEWRQKHQQLFIQRRRKRNTMFLFKDMKSSLTIIGWHLPADYIFTVVTALPWSETRAGAACNHSRHLDLTGVADENELLRCTAVMSGCEPSLSSLDPHALLLHDLTQSKCPMCKRSAKLLRLTLTRFLPKYTIYERRFTGLN